MSEAERKQLPPINIELDHPMGGVPPVEITEQDVADSIRIPQSMCLPEIPAKVLTASAKREIIFFSKKRKSALPFWARIIPG